jgi:hypothetical protein
MASPGALGSAWVAVASHGEKSLLIRPEDFLNPDVVRRDVLHLTLDRLNIPRPKGAAGFHCPARGGRFG